MTGQEIMTPAVGACATADVRSDSENLMAVISRAAADPNVDVSKLERLAALYEHISAKASETALNEVRRAEERLFERALAEAQSEMSAIATDKENTETRSHYATYYALDKAVRPIYTEHGFSMTFRTEPCEKSEWITVICRICHSGGHSREIGVPMPADGKGAKGGNVMTQTHATGSAISYGMRYLLKMVFNLAVGGAPGDDDDGNKATAARAITESQAKLIRDLIKESNADEVAFLAWLKASRIEEIRHSQFHMAVATIKAKISRAAKASVPA